MDRTLDSAELAPGGLTTRSYEEILRNIHDGVYTLGPEGTITWVNEVAVEEFDGGYTREELIGAPVTKILSIEDVERCANLIADLVANDPHGSRRCEIELQAADGRTIPGDLHLALLPAADGRFAGTLGVVRDITEQKRREQSLSVLNRVLRHNLRNELTIIMGGLDRAAAEDEDAVAAAKSAIERLLGTSEKAGNIEDVLRQGYAGCKPVDLGSVAADRATAAAERFPEAEVDISAPARCWVEATGLIDTMVDELVENAIVHADGDRPRVDVTVEPPADNGDWTKLVVADDGPGIPAAEIEALDVDTESPLVHSSGLGLWLVTWGIQGLGGRLTFDTNSGRGTTVRVELPSCEPPADPA